METEMKFDSLVVHAGDRKRNGGVVASTTPINLDHVLSTIQPKLDRVFAHEEEGYSYARYNNPTVDALEELTTRSMAVRLTRLRFRDRCFRWHSGGADRSGSSVVASHSLYGAAVKLFDQILGPLGIETSTWIFATPTQWRGDRHENPAASFWRASRTRFFGSATRRIAEFAHGVVRLWLWTAPSLRR